MSGRKGKIRKALRAVLIFTVLASGSVLWGCARQETTKTIGLPDTENGEKGIPGFVIKTIREYVYDGHSEDNLRFGWGGTGSDTAFLLRYGEKGYTFRKIDVNTKQTVSETFVDDRMLFNIQIAPGGRYISYEAETEEEAAPELVLFCTGEGERVVLRQWDECLQDFSYVWSDDGTKLFSWQNGDNPAFLPDTDWCVTCYDMDTLVRDNNGRLTVQKTEMKMPGSNYAWRHVLPDAHGTTVYVREEYETFSDSKKGEYLHGQAKKKAAQEANTENAEPEIESKGQPAKNWLLTPKELRIEKLPEYAKNAVWPIKYTKNGLYYQSEEKKLYLAGNIEEKPEVKELFSVSNAQVCICGKGDHIFLAEWTDDLQNMQISGVKMEESEPQTKQVLYQTACESADYAIAPDDAAIVLCQSVYLGDDRYSFKVTELGY